MGVRVCQKVNGTELNSEHMKGKSGKAGGSRLERIVSMSIQDRE